MTQRILSLIVILGLLIVTTNNSFATECRDPFSFNHTHYFLIENLNCDPATHQHRFYISPNSTYVGNELGFIVPGCVGENKFMDIYQGKTTQGGQVEDYIVAISGESSGNGWGEFAVTQTCTGVSDFIVDTTPTFVFDDIAVDYRIFNNDDHKTLIGYVKTRDNQINEVTMHANEATILSHAKKTFVNDDRACGKGIWEVTSDPELSPQIMAFILAIKENAEFTCTVEPPSTTTGLSVGAQIGIAAGVSAVVAGTGLLTWYCYVKRRGNLYFKLPDDARNVQL